LRRTRRCERHIWERGVVALLEVRNVEVRYGGVNAVHGISLEISENQVVGVLGANGAGKSSTLNAIAGVVRPAAGSIVFKGQDITGWRAHRVARAGMVQVPEGRRIIAPLNVEENLLLGSYGRKDRSGIASSMERVFELFPILLERRRIAGGLLSGGEQQMLAFGRGLMADPALMLLDEPTMGLAPVMVDAVMDAVAEIAKQGIAILMVEQNAAAALDLVDFVYVLEQGAVVRSGPVEQLREDPAVIEAFLGIDVEVGPA
jgi:branched-chain amino acid transport system ATP-binding protein